MGICFIGKRQFPEFIREYIAPSAGDIVDLDSLEKVREFKAAAKKAAKASR